MGFSGSREDSNEFARKALKEDGVVITEPCCQNKFLIVKIMHDEGIALPICRLRISSLHGN
jgi:hypothetical protein